MLFEDLYRKQFQDTQLPKIRYFDHPWLYRPSFPKRRVCFSSAERCWGNLSGAWPPRHRRERAPCCDPDRPGPDRDRLRQLHLGIALCIRALDQGGVDLLGTNGGFAVGPGLGLRGHGRCQLRLGCGKAFCACVSSPRPNHSWPGPGGAANRWWHSSVSASGDQQLRGRALFIGLACRHLDMRPLNGQGGAFLPSVSLALA